MLLCESLRFHLLDLCSFAIRERFPYKTVGQVWELILSLTNTGQLKAHDEFSLRALHTQLV